MSNKAKAAARGFAHEVRGIQFPFNNCAMPLLRQPQRLQRRRIRHAAVSSPLRHHTKIP
jgi:hypothetical protein